MINYNFLYSLRMIAIVFFEFHLQKASLICLIHMKDYTLRNSSSTKMLITQLIKWKFFTHLHFLFIWKTHTAILHCRIELKLNFKLLTKHTLTLPLSHFITQTHTNNPTGNYVILLTIYSFTELLQEITFLYL